MPKQTPRQAIKDAAKLFEEIMVEELSLISDEMVEQVMIQWRAKKKSMADIKWPGELRYLARIREALTLQFHASIEDARKEVPLAKGIRLSDQEFQFASVSVLFDKLPKVARDFITMQSDLLVGTQLGDLQKNLKFQYFDAYDTTEYEDQIKDDLRQVCVEYVDGNSVRSGANLLASKTVNEARGAFFFDEDVLEEIDAFEFVNGDPVTPICQDLNGTVFRKDDPNMFRYTPPLHWNCKSYIVPILKGNLGKRKPSDLKPSTKALEDSIQFGEAACDCAGCT